MALDAFGNKCGCCGYDTHLEALEFHHLDPSEKESGMSSMMRSRSWKAIVEELRKCILVCPTCHREVHLGFREIHNTIQRFDELYSTYISPQGQIIGRD